MEYVVDEYAQMSYEEEHVNVDCVSSWKLDKGPVAIDFHNGWGFDAEYWSNERCAAVLIALQRNQAGRR